MPKMDDRELIAAVEAQEATSLDAWTGILSGDRAEALARYRGEPDGTEIEGRSQVVSRDLLDTVEWIMPSLARIFLSGDEIGKFAPLGPQDEAQADIETAVCNWYLMDRNDGYTQLSAAMRDAMLLRNGYAVGWWTTKTWEETERYSGLGEEELALIVQDKKVEITEREIRTNELGEKVYDVKVVRKKADEWVAIESIPPDEVRVSRRHRMNSLEDCDFVQWRRETTIGQLRAEGLEVEDDAPAAPDSPLETTYRNRFDESTFPNDQSTDPSRRRVILKDNWIRLDLEGTGKPQLWRITFIDGTTKVLVKEEAEVIPIASFTGIAYPHSHIGTSIHDLVRDLAEIKQALQRQLLDNVYVSNNQRVAVDATKVNIDDLLVSRPNGVIRMNGDPASGIMPLMTPDLTTGIMGAIEYVDSVKEARTGVTRYSAGLDANTLNKTATGVQQIQAAANQRIEMIARTLAGGYVDLFRIIHRLVSKHSTKAVQLEINGQWKVIDPRSWAKRTQFRVSVGMGTGTPEAQMAKLAQIAQFMMPAQQMALIGPQEMYNWFEEYLKAAGFRNTRKFVHEPPMKPAPPGPDGQPQIDPKTGQPAMVPDIPPPPPNPLVEVEHAKQRGQMQIKQMELQAQQQPNAEHQFELMKLKMQLESNERIAAMNNAVKTDLQLAESAERFALQKHLQDNENMRVAADFVSHAHDLAQQSHQHLMDTHAANQQELSQKGEHLGKLTEALQNVVQTMQQPMDVEIMRDPKTGRAIGARRKPAKQQTLQ